MLICQDVIHDHLLQVSDYIAYKGNKSIESSHAIKLAIDLC